MSPRRLVVMLSGALSTAVFAVTTPVAADDDETRRGDCARVSEMRLRILDEPEGRLTVIGIVFSDDEDIWEWRMRHNGDESADGRIRARDADRSLRIERTMIDLPGVDRIVFAARNTETGEWCRRERDF